MDTELRKQNRSQNTDSRTGIKQCPKFKYWFRAVYESVIDRYYHVNTTRAIKLKEHDNLVNFMYEPYPYVLVKASLFGCRNIYGVDLSKELLADADANMMACQRNNPDMHYELLCMNAKNYTFSSDINKVFMHNPFTLKIGIKVLNALMISIQERPREVILFLSGSPSMNKYMENINEFKVIGRGENNLCVYRYIPEMDE